MLPLLNLDKKALLRTAESVEAFVPTDGTSFHWTPVPLLAPDDAMYAAMANGAAPARFSVPEPDPHAGQVVLTRMDGVVGAVDAWMNHNPGLAGQSYGSRWSNDARPHTHFQTVAVYDVNYTHDHPLLRAFEARRDAFEAKKCTATTGISQLAAGGGIFSLSTQYLRHFVPAGEIKYFTSTNTNEQVLCHATSAARVTSILRDGFRITRENSQNPESDQTDRKTNSLARFTVGNYFTDQATKSDRFARPFEVGGHKVWMLILARVLLGCPIITDKEHFDRQQDLSGAAAYRRYSVPISGSFDDMEEYTRVLPELAGVRDSTIVIDGAGTEDGNVSEFVTYGADQQIPMAVVFYRRGVDE